MPEAAIPSFDLVVATVDRVAPLARLLESIDRQRDVPVRLIVVDQNRDDRLDDVLGAHRGLEIVRTRSERGLSRARNEGLRHVRSDLVAFPDDDCTYPQGLLDTVAHRFAGRPVLDGLTGRATAEDGAADASWAREPAILEADNLWNRVISFTIFLRRTVVERVGGFDERLGLGSGSVWSSGEEIDYVLRAIRSGARIEYDPLLTVHHPVKRYTPGELRAVGLRDGASIGWILRRHRYGPLTTTRMLVRPIGGVGVALAHGDLTRASFHAETLRGRLKGYLGSSPS